MNQALIFLVGSTLLLNVLIKREFQKKNDTQNTYYWIRIPSWFPDLWNNAITTKVKTQCANDATLRCLANSIFLVFTVSLRQPLKYCNLKPHITFCFLCCTTPHDFARNIIHKEEDQCKYLLLKGFFIVQTSFSISCT